MTIDPSVDGWWPVYEARFPLPWSAPARTALALAMFALVLAARELVLPVRWTHPHDAFIVLVCIATCLLGTRPAFLVCALGMVAGLYESIPAVSMPLSDATRDCLVHTVAGAAVILAIDRLIAAQRELLGRNAIHEKKLRGTLARDGAVVAALSEGLILLGPDGVVTSVNQRAAALLGMTKDQMRAMPGLAGWYLVRPDGSPCPVEELPASRVLSTGIPVHGERVGLPIGDGGVRWLESNAVPLLDEGGSVSGVVVTFVDVTGRVESEVAARDHQEELERLVDHRTQSLRESEISLREQAQRIDEISRYHAALVDKASVGLTVFAADGRCLSTNAAACSITGLTRQQILEPSAEDVATWVPEDVPGIFREVHADHRPRSIERRVESGGREVDLHLEMQPFSFRGEPCVLVISKDLTDFRRVERELREASDAKSEFLSNMSHEIRTPLNVILGAAQVLEGAGLGPEQREMVKLLRNSGRSLLAMLNDVLDLAKIEAGRLELERAPFELDGVIEQVAAQMSMGVGERGIEVVIFEPAERVRSLSGDSLRIGQVLANLVGNALKFTERGCVSLSVSEIGEGPGTVRLRFSVADTGIGIPQGRLGPILEPFTQATPETSRRYGGTGLGLSIARHLVGLMGSELRVRSGEGQGSEFSFEVDLPLQGGAAPAAEPALPQLRVVVADDHESARGSLLSAAQLLGWEAEGEATGADLLARLETELAAGRRVDFVFLDAKLGTEDGTSLAREIRARWADRAPAVILLATAAQRAVLRKRGGVADLVLTKPVTLGALREAAWEIEQQQWQQQRQRLSDLRLLVADDGEINRAVAQLLLEREGARVECVDDGREVLAVLRARPAEFDLVLMDLRMPGMDGLEATRAIREELGLRDLPVIACTAWSTLEKRQEAAAAGVDAYTTKPFAADELVATILRVVKEPRAGRVAPEAASVESAGPGSVARE